jgi:hypothetical protein
MKHIVVFPLHGELMIQWLNKVTPEIKGIFDKAVVSVTPMTEETQKDKLTMLAADKFFDLNYNLAGTKQGEHFVKGIRKAAELADDDDLVHLCTLDRLSVAITINRAEFKKDMELEKTSQTPILYERSDKAWGTHPKNYRAIEDMATIVGKRLFGVEMDYFWNDLAVKGELLSQLSANIDPDSLKFLAQLIVPIRNQLTIKKVDWGEWEDPTFFGLDPATLKKEREESKDEDQKRMGYVLPTIEWLLWYWKDQNKEV